MQSGFLVDLAHSGVEEKAREKAFSFRVSFSLFRFFLLHLEHIKYTRGSPFVCPFDGSSVRLYVVKIQVECVFPWQKRCLVDAWLITLRALYSRMFLTNEQLNIPHFLPNYLFMYPFVTHLMAFFYFSSWSFLKL